MAALLHFVGYRLRDTVTPAKRRRIATLLRRLAEEMQGVELLALGRNVSRSRFAAGWDFGAVLHLADAKLLPAYLEHPLHKKLSLEASQDFFESCVVFDIPLVTGDSQ